MQPFDFDAAKGWLKVCDKADAENKTFRTAAGGAGKLTLLTANSSTIISIKAIFQINEF